LAVHKGETADVSTSIRVSACSSLQRQDRLGGGFAGQARAQQVALAQNLRATLTTSYFWPDGRSLSPSSATNYRRPLECDRLHPYVL
jgi:hypothetical protein